MIADTPYMYIFISSFLLRNNGVHIQQEATTYEMKKKKMKETRTFSVLNYNPTPSLIFFRFNFWLQFISVFLSKLLSAAINHSTRSVCFIAIYTMA